MEPTMTTAIRETSARSAPATGISEAPPAARLASIDALRGFDMFWIIGAGAVVHAVDKLSVNSATRFLSTQLQHVTWTGFHFYDLIFPLFLFIVGVSMVFSLDRAIEKGGRGRAMWRVLRRSILLYVLGVFYSGGLSQPWPDVALAGVLQRIAACYLFASLVYCCIPSQRGIAAVSAALLLGYWGLLAWAPFPDLRLEPATVEGIAARIGSTSPAEIAAAVPDRIHGVYEEGRNLTNYIDFRYLPGRKTQFYYINEGLLSTLPAIALPLFGALAGTLLKNERVSPPRKVAWLLVAGAAGVALSLLWDMQFPIIKRIWTSSFVLLTAGLSAICLALFYYLIDVRRLRVWCQPFIWIGSNAITLYLSAQIVNFQAVAARLAGGDVKQFLDARLGEGAGSVCVALVGLGLMVWFARFLYKRGILIRV
jgi:predicted acyltransferase